MNDCYSPQTGEHIETENPAPWMGRAGTPAPDYSRASSSAFWRGDHWEVVMAAPDTDSIVTAVTYFVQKRLDDFARTRNYDGILSACTYATSTVPKFAGEGQCCVNARDATWAKLYEIMAEVQSGSRPMPAGYEDIEPHLPPLEWPA